MTTNQDGRKILTVTQLNEYIKALIDSNSFLASVYIRGEISNFTNHYRTGHFYFTLKDEGGIIRAVMFSSAASKLKFLPENGMKVIVSGRVSAFVRDGQYQLYVNTMEPDGVGALYIAFEQLKQKLAAEGMFDEKTKKPLPKIPLRVGVITSPTGAAVRDIINILGRRFPAAEVVLYPTLVQGKEAVPQLIEGIRFFNKTKRADVIIIGRGGGSIEDLWAFNDETLAREIKKSQIPTISAVGHETDFTICDFVADRRAPTPSAAAEIAVPDIFELKRKINNITGHIEVALRNIINIRRKELKRLAESRALTSPTNHIDDKRMIVTNLQSRIEGAIKYTLSEKRADFIRHTSKLETLNPLSIISRGYSAVFKEDGTLIKSVSQVNIGDSFFFKTSDGRISGKVTDIRKEENENER